MVQADNFRQDLQLLQKGKPLHKTSKILNLNPFLDENGLLRVGGRLQNSDLSYAARHPILLPHKHTFTRLLFEREHAVLFHVGPQMLLASIRQRFWPVSGRSIAKFVVRNCVRCFKASPKTIQPFMGNLPTERVSQALPFTKVGVDYAGPIVIKTTKGRGCKTYKSYICLFVCLTTKALHLELVSDLTAQSFILCLRRFAARRGKPAEILSDNGRNFVGAHSELKQLALFLIRNESEISERAANEGISWKFIPPYSPNFGGLWEAGVKSCKLLLKKIVNNSLLTYEEFNTLLIQIEGILNSRPLTPLSSNPNDLQPLCPAHFLIGRPITAIPDPDVLHISETRLSRYQHIQQLQQRFWRRWTKEYLVELQKRSKWNTSTGSVQIGTMVLIRDDNLPPLQWKMGRIELIHPGTDGVVRVVTIRTTDGLIKRATNRVCPLPNS